MEYPSPMLMICHNNQILFMKFSSENFLSSQCKISSIGEFSRNFSLDCSFLFLTSSRLFFLSHFSTNFFLQILSNLNVYDLPHFSTLFFSFEQSEARFFFHPNEMKNFFCDHFRGALAIYRTIFGDFPPFLTTRSSNQNIPSQSDS